MEKPEHALEQICKPKLQQAMTMSDFFTRFEATKGINQADTQEEEWTYRDPLTEVSSSDEEAITPDTLNPNTLPTEIQHDEKYLEEGNEIGTHIIGYSGSPATLYNHGNKSWTSCYYDDCQIHLTEKEGSGYFLKKSRDYKKWPISDG